MDSQLNVRSWLSQMYDEKRMKNPNYSMRSFARTLGVSPGHLNNLFTGRRKLTQGQAMKIVDQLNLGPSKRRQILHELLNLEVSEIKTPQSKLELEEESFRLISKWYHLAILALIKVRQSKATAKWIGEQLGISSSEAGEALSRLKKLGLLKKVGEKLYQDSAPINAHSKTKNAAFRSFHLETLHKACDSLVHDPVDERYLAAKILAVKSDDLPDAIAMVNQFLEDFCDRFGDGPSSDRVYALTTQFIPYSRRKPSEH